MNTAKKSKDSHTSVALHFTRFKQVKLYKCCQVMGIYVGVES